MDGAIHHYDYLLSWVKICQDEIAKEAHWCSMIVSAIYNIRAYEKLVVRHVGGR